jgi:hypothetical protein
MSLGNVVDELLNEHSLSDTGTTEETNLSTTSIGSKEIDDFDTSLENLSSGRLFDERRRIVMNGKDLVALDGTTLVDGFTNDVHDTTERALADGNLDWSTGVDDLLATYETLGTVHSNSTNRVLTEMSSHLKNQTTAMEVLNLERVENGGKGLGIELHINDGTNDCLDLADGSLGLGRVGAGFADEHGKNRRRRNSNYTACKAKRK